MEIRKAILKITRPQFSLLLLIPYIVSYPTGDSSYSDVSYGLGRGQYAYEDCSGVHTQTYYDAGVNYTHKYVSPFRLGINGSVGNYHSYRSPYWLRLNPSVNNYIFLYPDLALDWKYFSLGTTGVRIGSTDEIYIQYGIANQTPLFSGRGFFNLGVGGNPGKPFSHLWVGMNSIPYRNLGFAIQPEFSLGDNKFIFFNGRYGSYLNQAEYGFSVGMRIRSF